MNDAISRKSLLEWLEIEIDLSSGNDPVLKADKWAFQQIKKEIESGRFDKAQESAQEREVLVRTLSDIISAIDRGDLYKTKMSNGLDDVIHRAREALRK